MERHLKIAAAVAAVAFAAAASAAPAPAGKAADQKKFPEIFQKPPAEAVKALNRTVGGRFSSGYVFIGGRYMKPPYRVERSGNVLKINGVQITGEIVPWSDFAKTQRGAKAVQTEAAAPEPPPPPNPEPDFDLDYSSYDYTEDDVEASLDDLFDDAPSPKKKNPAKKRAAAKPKPPAPAVTYVFDGEFATNETSNAYKESINAERTRIDKLLRSGGFICTGPNYQMVSGDAGAAKHLMEKLPDIMKRNPTREAFGKAIVSAGFKFIPPKLIDDLFRNRADYTLLIQRQKDAEEAKLWSKMLKGDK